MPAIKFDSQIFGVPICDKHFIFFEKVRTEQGLRHNNETLRFIIGDYMRLVEKEDGRY